MRCHKAEAIQSWVLRLGAQSTGCRPVVVGQPVLRMVRRCNDRPPQAQCHDGLLAIVQQVAIREDVVEVAEAHAAGRAAGIPLLCAAGALTLLREHETFLY